MFGNSKEAREADDEPPLTGIQKQIIMMEQNKERLLKEIQHRSYLVEKLSEEIERLSKL